MKKKKKEDWFMRLIGVVILSCILFIGCNVINHTLGLQDDGVVEEFFEEILEAKTGLDVDLTPLTNEQH